MNQTLSSTIVAALTMSALELGPDAVQLPPVEEDPPPVVSPEAEPGDEDEVSPPRLKGGD